MHNVDMFECKEENMEKLIKLNIIGGGTLCAPLRSFGSYYKDFITGDTCVEVGIKPTTYLVRESVSELDRIIR
tara:strand:- start:1 stop:219 length:219 start_codon:yes stop_codon:yes gene_type:complete